MASNKVIRLSGFENMGAIIRRARQEQGLSQEELAKKLGKTQSEISKIERRGAVRTPTLEAIGKALGIVFNVGA